MFRQCKMERKIEGGSAHTTSYIPEPFCVVGKTLKLKDDDGKWEDGWKVTFAGQQRSFEQVDTQSRQHKYQRRASDI